ncbi:MULTISPECIES: hypothetical protein [Bizionia]|uniref:Uncharacterized protein n=1 Tax=Bizionia algoritergicola TaxID=291187 RepID=A0A5D0QZI3_9FLAO|nr:MULTISPECIES: hypothetical protein [Bizionia]TYB74627.1 hypothetical protein ES675_00355 [Bizionia algoritergicola]
MKALFSILLLLFMLHSISAQENIYIDENGQEIDNQDYQKRWRNKDLLLTTWSHIDTNGIKNYTLKKDLYMTGNYDYNEITLQLEIIINREIPKNNIILIEYNYKDDLCTVPRWDNNWTEDNIKDRKKFTDPLRKSILKKNISYITLYEEGMTLANKPNDKNEYFFIDAKKTFRNKLFIYPTNCGSYAIIKPNGETLIRNGEYRPDWMVTHLEQKNWKLFFDSND